MRKLFLVAFFCLLAWGVSGCGKKGKPAVPGENRQFSFTSLEAVMQNGCIQVHATVSGSWWNVAQIYMEVQPSNKNGYCNGCPFLPTEQALFDPAEIFQEPGKGQIAFQFCPLTENAADWRWRLIGKNIVRDLPYVLSPVLAVSENM